MNEQQFVLSEGVATTRPDAMPSSARNCSPGRASADADEPVARGLASWRRLCDHAGDEAEERHAAVFDLLARAERVPRHDGLGAGWRSPEPRPRYQVIVVGGGGHGLATAYYLAKEHGLSEVAVLEKGWLGGGNAGRNTTIIRSNYLWDESARIYDHAVKLWESLSQELNFNVMFSQRGVMHLAHSVHDLQEVRRRGHANRLNGSTASS